MKKIKKTNILDVAKEANVSIATVSRYFNKTAKVSKEKKIKIEKAVKKLNFSVNIGASSLTRSKGVFITIILPETNNIEKDTLDGIIDTSEIYGYKNLIFREKGLKNISNFNSVYHKISGSNTMGAINLSTDLNKNEIDKLENYNFPVVCFNNKINFDEKIYNFKLDKKHLINSFIIKLNQKKINDIDIISNDAKITKIFDEILNQYQIKNIKKSKNKVFISDDLLLNQISNLKKDYEIFSLESNNFIKKLPFKINSSPNINYQIGVYLTSQLIKISENKFKKTNKIKVGW